MRGRPTDRETIFNRLSTIFHALSITLSINPLHLLYQRTSSTHPINTPNHHIISTHLIPLPPPLVLCRGQELEEMYTSTMYAFRYQRNPDAAEAVFRQLQRRSALALAHSTSSTSSSSAAATATTTTTTDADEAESGGSTVPPLRASTPSYNALLAVYAVSKVSE